MARGLLTVVASSGVVRPVDASAIAITTSTATGSPTYPSPLQMTLRSPTISTRAPLPAGFIHRTRGMEAAEASCTLCVMRLLKIGGFMLSAWTQAPPELMPNQSGSQTDIVVG